MSATVVRLGKYELIAPIGKGGMAQVFLARQTGPLAFEKIVVVKSIHEELTTSTEFVGMLLDEARIAALIKHPNVVDIYDLGEADGKYFIAMEFIAGRPLSNVLGRAKGTDNYLDALGIAHIIAEAADGLHAAHSLRSLSGELLNLVHRDVTPANIMVAYDGGVKLVDFGVAKSLGNMNTTQAGQVKGKMGYLSPEQINGLPVTPQTDVFSLGIVLWESLVVARLFKGDTMGATISSILNKTLKPPSHYRDDVPAELDRITLKALARSTEDRYQSAEEMRDELHDFLRESNNYRGRRQVAQYMEKQFAHDIESDRKLVTQVDFSVPLVIETDAEAELSSPNSSPRNSPGIAPGNSPEVTIEEVDDLSAVLTPTAQLAEAAPEASLLARLKELPPRIQYAIGGGAVFLVIVLAIAFSGGESSKPVAAAVDEADAAVVDITPEVVNPVSADAAVADAVVAEPDTIIDPSIDAVPDAAVEMVLEPDVLPDRPEIIKKTPRQKAQALYQSGRAKFANGDLSGAKRDYEASLQLRPGYGPAQKSMASLYEKAGVKSKAIQYYKQYLQSSPKAGDRAKIEARIKQLGG